MLLDALVNFVPIGSPLSIVGGAGISFGSNVYDILGLGVGVAPSERIIGLPSSGVFGEDTGIGAIKPQVQVNLGVIPTANAGAPTLNVAFQGAPDLGAGGGYQPGAWQTLVETGPLTVAQLAAAASATLGYPIARFDFPPAFPPGLDPRYLRLLFQLAAGTSFAAGTIASAIVTMVRDDLAIKYQPRNFSVGAVN